MPESLIYVTLLSLLLPSRKLVAFRNESRLGMHVHPCMFPACVCQATWRPASVSMDASPTHALSGVGTHKLVQIKKIACPELCLPTVWHCVFATGVVFAHVRGHGSKHKLNKHVWLVVLVTEVL